jgi:MFS family permease
VDRPAAPQTALPTAAGSILIGVCAAVYFLDGLIHSILGPLAPEMAQALHLKPAQLGPIFSANLTGQCVGLIGFPFLARRAGERAVVLVCLLGFGLAQCGTALAAGALSLFSWRFGTGIFLGGCLPSCLALVTAAAAPPKRGFAIMVLFTGYGLGATVAGLVATAFTDLGGWRIATIAAGLPCFITMVAAWRWLREDLNAERGLSPEPASGHTSLSFQIFAPRYLLGTCMLWLLFICMLTISYCLNSWLPTLLVEVGRDQKFAALSVSIFSLGGIVSALGVGVLIDRLGATPTLISFLTVSSILLFCIGQLLASASPTLLLVLLAVCGFFVLGAYGGVNVVLATYYPAPLRATGIGWTKSVGRIGTLAAPMMIGAGLSAGMTDTTVMSLFAVPATAGVLSLVGIAIATGRSRRTD